MYYTVMYYIVMHYIVMIHVKHSLQQGAQTVQSRTDVKDYWGHPGKPLLKTEVIRLPVFGQN